MQTQVKELMKKNPVIISADMTLKEAAKQMKSIDCGVLPVGTANNLEGIITDCDIVIRAVAEGVDINMARVSDFMTMDVCCCNESATLQDAAEQMCSDDVSRLIVQDSDDKVCGIITFGGILRKDEDRQEISEVVECAVGKKAA